MLENFMLAKIVVILVLGVMIGYILSLEKITIREFERGLEFKNGKFRRALGPGRYYITHNIKILIIDMRQENYMVRQNILTSDNIHIGLNINIRTRVKQPYVAYVSSQNYQQDTHDIARSVIKEIGKTTKTKIIVKEDDKFEQKLKKPLSKKLLDIGIELLSIEIVDAVIPHSLQESIAQSVDDLVKKEEKKRTVGFRP